MYFCEICGTSFSRRHNLKIHCRTVHCGDERVCNEHKGAAQNIPTGTNINVDIVLYREIDSI